MEVDNSNILKKKAQNLVLSNIVLIYEHNYSSNFPTHFELKVVFYYMYIGTLKVKLERPGIMVRDYDKGGIRNTKYTMLFMN